MALIQPSSFLRKVSPRGAIADFRTVYEQAGENRWRFALAAAAVTFSIFSVMWQEGGRGLPRPPVVTYITSWPADRTDAEIIASNIANQRRKERLAAEQAKREEDVRQMYKTLGRVSGMDVEAMEKKAMADRAAEARAAKARTEAALRAVEAAKAKGAAAKPDAAQSATAQTTAAKSDQPQQTQVAGQ